MKFSFKLNLYMFLLLFVFTAVLSLLVGSVIDKEVQNAYAQYASGTADMIVRDPQVTAALRDNQFQTLRVDFDKLLREQSDIRFIVLTDEQGRFLLDTSNGQAEQLDRWAETLSRLTAGRSEVRRKAHLGESTEDLYISIMPMFYQGKIWRWALIGISLRELFQVVLPRIYSLIIGVGLGLTILFGAIIFLLLQKSLKPINEMIIGAKMIASGHFDFPFETNSNDELGKLAATFTGMSQSLKRTFQKLQKSASVDEITNLYNQTFFFGLLEQELARARRYKYAMALVLVHLPRLAEINQRLSREEQEELLVLITRGLQDCIRNTDNLARYHEDTFAIILTQTDSKGAKYVVSRIRKLVAAKVKEDPAFLAIELGLKVGVSTVAPRTDDMSLSKEELLAATEKNLE